MGESKVLKLAEGLRVVDSESHTTERHDLVRERAPKGFVEHPNPVEIVTEKVASLRPESQRKIMGENAAKLYRLSPAGA